MATEAQTRANRENAQHSSGPKTEEGKARSCRNNFRWGFVGSFTVLPTESQEDFDSLCQGLFTEHSPSTTTEQILVEKMAQHLWLSRRAQDYQDGVILHADTLPPEEVTRRFALFLRYETANERAFHKCLTELLRLRAERLKEEIGFERKSRETETHQNRERRRAEHDSRQAERHKLAVALAEAKLDHQNLLNAALEPANLPLKGLEKAA